MDRGSRQHVSAKGQRPEQPARAPTPRPQPGSRGRLIVLLLSLAVVLAAVAGWARLRVGANTPVRIPPVETAELLPAVAQEIREKQARIVENPTQAEAWGEYGLVLLAHGFRKEAGDCFEAAEGREPADYRWPYYLGMTMGVWDADKSRRAFQRAVEKAPTRLSLRLRLAEWLFDLRQLEECEQHLDIALEQDPGSAAPNCSRLVCCSNAVPRRKV